MKITTKAGLFLSLAAAGRLVGAIELDVTDPGMFTRIFNVPFAILIIISVSIKNATSTVANGLMKWYTGNVTDTPSTIAVLPRPYYWWEAGAMWGAMIDYWHYTNDSTYNNVTSQALLSQVGPNNDYMVPARQNEEGNDDQGFWGFATMSAAEKGYTPTPSGTPSWLQLTINLWNTQAARWDLSSCGGGLKWQIFPSNGGYDYKNSVSNGAFFQLSARLARYTGNSTYLDWATKTWDWTKAIGFIDDNYNVYDGSDDRKNCSEVNKIQWSYSLGIYMYGAAVMYNYTNGSAIWAERTQGFLNASAMFFSPYDNATNVMYEAACEDVNTCNYDQWSFKAYLSRFMWATTQLANFTYPAVSTLLTTSAKAAAGACSGGVDGQQCGAKWYVGGFDGNLGPGEQLSALEVMQGLLVNGTQPPITSGDVHIATASGVPTDPVPSASSVARMTSASKRSVHAGRAAAVAGILAVGSSLQGGNGM
jgi:mannan endo-1,6-alpha-mannosidase